MISAKAVIESLKLQPLEPEGGYFLRIFESPDSVSTERGDRRLGTSIYYLVTPESPSKLHTVKSTEIYHFYLGDPLTLALFHPDGRSQKVILGPDLAAGQIPQFVIEPGVCQGSFIEAPRTGYALVGATCIPGFDFADFTIELRNELLLRFPGDRGIIERLTG